LAGAGQIGIGNTGQLDFAALLQLMVNTGMVAPKGACAHNGNANCTWISQAPIVAQAEPGCKVSEVSEMSEVSEVSEVSTTQVLRFQSFRVSGLQRKNSTSKP
jgi:hypothetical protein